LQQRIQPKRGIPNIASWTPVLTIPQLILYENERYKCHNNIKSTILSRPRTKVSPRWQMLFAVIPFVNFWAAYRIGKLRWFLLLWIILQFGVSFLIIFSIPFPFRLPIYLAIYIPVIIYYMRKWSIEWNSKMDDENLS
jgi:hypothetical protein